MRAGIDRRDLEFLLIDWLGLPSLLGHPRFAEHDLESINAILDLSEEIAVNELAPYLRASDTIEPRLNAHGGVEVLPEVAAAVRVVGEAGLFGAPFDTSLGGLQLPNVVHVACLGILMGGSISAASYLLLTVANARLIASFGNPEQVDQFARPQIAGRAMGTMCLSEPHAGSSLGDISARAVPDGEDGLGRRFRLFGSKMWISAGDHDVTDDIVHLVLAKASGPDGGVAEGSKGISLFIVPKRLADSERNDIAVVGLNHKLGYRGIPNCALNFGEGYYRPEGCAGAIGWLVGEVGQGLAQMFQMMNEARVSVGLGSAMLAYRGYRLALDYARARPQGRIAGVRGGSQTLIVNHPDVQRMLLAQKAYAEGALALVLYSARLLDDASTGGDAEREVAERLLALLTPIAKTWPSEWAQQSLHYAIQVHGGAGYTRDFEVELLYRDNRLNPIHEGTTGIQGLDLVGRKLRRDGGNGFRLLQSAVARTLAKASRMPELSSEQKCVADAWDQVADGMERILVETSEVRVQAQATDFLFAMGHAVVGWLWLDQAVVCNRRMVEATDSERVFLEGKLSACRYFSVCELPKVKAWLFALLEGKDTGVEGAIFQAD